MDPADPWIVEPGSRADLAAIDTSSTPDAPGDKAKTLAVVDDLLEQLTALQNRLWAEAKRSPLIVFQAMDAGGKDSTIRRVFRGLDPQGVHVKAFRAPSEEELAHDFLWRVHAKLPAAGEIGIFNRSHYEDVVAVRVRRLVPQSIWEPRFDSIVDFERHLHRSGISIVKLFLHISKKEQENRLQKRRERPDKTWKWHQSDDDDRERWSDFQKAYEEAINRTSIPEAPWRIIPADRKWYRDWAVLTVLTQTLEDMDLRYPKSKPS